MRKLALLTTTLLLSGAAHAEAPFSFDAAPGKLPKTVVPDDYRIELAPDLDKLTLTGSETIQLHVRTATDTIILNQAGLKLNRAALAGAAEATITLDEKAQTATLRFPHPLSPGAYLLQIDYSGPIPQSPNGIYYDDYKTAQGVKKRMLVTQFEVADARRMFPGWDEPAFKAVFHLSVTLPAGLTAVSNMPGSSEAAPGGLQHIVFAATPRMSTYLLALLAGDMTAVRGEADGVHMGAYAPTGRQDQAQYALDIEQHVLPYYDTYFGVHFPLPKLDLIAVPGNYEAGAMENWGAITFIDDAMLFDPKTSAPATRQQIAYVVAHEMAHQWSGDLVTMGWWDNIWLNEGFATWMGWKVTDHLHPDWQIWPRQHGAREEAMAQDALPTTHPVQQVIRDESEADSAFDQISYQKGSMIIRMVEDWIGADVFRDGMRGYMKAHAFGNTTSADLWNALGTAAHTDVGKVASTFTEQPGIPLVHVARACTDGHGVLTLTQDRFAIHDPHPKPMDWRIPVTLGAPGTAPRHLMLQAAPATVQAGGCDAPVKVNLGENGYYRTQYDPASLQALAKIFPSLSPADRANLLGDQFALFVANRADLAAYLNLLGDLGDERDIAVWTDTLAHLERLDRALVGSPLRARFDSFAAGLIRPQAARLGWDAKPGEAFVDTLLRPEIIGALGTFQDPATLAEAHRRFDAFVKEPASLSPDLRLPVLTMVGHTADQATYDTLRRLGISATSTEEKLRYFTAMAGAADPKLVAQSVAFAEAGEVPNGRITRFLAVISRESDHSDLVYRLTVPRVSVLAARIPPSSLGQSVLAAAASGSFDPAMADTLLADASSRANLGAKIYAARVADAIKSSAELRGLVTAELPAWLGGVNR